MHVLIRCLRLLLLFCNVLAILFPTPASAQSGTLEGIIIDAESRKPIPFATVFLASTTYGLSASEDGTFAMRNVPNGKYDIIVSSLGYESLSMPVVFAGGSFKLTFPLKSEAVELGEIVVEGASKKHYGTFLKYFLGTTKNAGQCTVKNSEVIDLRYDEKTKILTATADDPIEIENRALGYRVYYLLEEFRLDEPNKTFRVFGIPRFEALEPTDAKQLRQWNRARDNAYHGSLNHFMRSLAKRQLRKNDFSIYRQGINVPLNEKNLFGDSASNELKFQGNMEVIFNGERESQEYVRRFVAGAQRTTSMPFQTSILTFTEPRLVIHPNGYYENRKSLILGGYLAWAEFIADLVPIGYEPTTLKR